MKVVFHRRFEKQMAKLPLKVKQRAIERVQLFVRDPLAVQLRSHALQTPYKGSYSIDVTGDYRAIYQLIDGETALFTHIGTHSQLYR